MKTQKGKAIVERYEEEREAVLAAAKREDMAELTDMCASVKAFFETIDEAYLSENAQRKMENMEAFLGDLPPRLMLSALQAFVNASDWANELLGPSDAIFEMADKEANAMHAEGKRLPDGLFPI